MWIINAIVVHILLLGSIFVIYFRSPVVSELRPQKSLTDWKVEAPAHRLVLFVTDGLRAESFFRNNCSDVPNLRELFENQGLVGISHTRVPTESRPGHIALIAGLYEDPSAVTRGWKENPIDFDTVFNRSDYTYAWGANDVLHIFARMSEGGRRMTIDAYDHELDFSGHAKTYELDEWVFDHVRSLLKRKRAELVKKKKIVFFLHLLGLDSAGHVHKPGSELFLENLHRTERGIVDIFNEFEATFEDGRTSYILTSDHGMTNAGSHGAGDPFETETPFFLWGAGIALHPSSPGRTFQSGSNKILPLYELEQAQFAPLMSALIGSAPPMNNFGKLPDGFLEVPNEYAAFAAHSNALQLVEQFKALLLENQKGFFTSYLRHFRNLDLDKISAYIESTEKRIELGEYETAKAASYLMMDAALEGIDYYHSYYRNALLVATTITFLGWLYYLQQLLITFNRETQKGNNIPFPLLVASVIMLAFVFLQRVPFAIGLYLLLPCIIWMLVLKGQQNFVRFLKLMPLMQLILIICSAEFLVFSFFNRKLISLAFLVFAIVSNYRSFITKGLKFYVWLIFVVTLSTFPLFPPSVGYQNPYLLMLGMILIYIRPYLTKSRLANSTRIISTIGLANALLCIYQHTNQMQVWFISHCISWCFLAFSFLNIILYPTTGLKQRVELIFYNLTCLYSILCTSYESLFILMLASELMLSLSAQEQRKPSKLDVTEQQLEQTKKFNVNQLQNSFQIACSILLYTFFSFFGTGNIASVSSFDPNIIRCFLSTFSPFIIMMLVILKLIVPIILNISIIFGMLSFARANERQIFICLLIICDIMGMNFLFLVRNQGSWLEIGTSISHFVIMEVTTLVLLIFTGISKYFLRLNQVINFKLNKP